MARSKDTTAGSTASEGELDVGFSVSIVPESYLPSLDLSLGLSRLTSDQPIDGDFSRETGVTLDLELDFSRYLTLTRMGEPRFEIRYHFDGTRSRSTGLGRTSETGHSARLLMAVTF